MAESLKISPPFASRLRRLRPDQQLRALVLLNFQAALQQAARPRGEARKQALAQAKESTRAALGHIDAILEDHGGRRIGAALGSLGAVHVEASAAGLRALAEDPTVKAVLEDQPVSALR